MKIDTDFVRG